MALIRCNEHKPSPSATKYEYISTAKKPIGYPNTAVVCGKKGCLDPGLVWLDERETIAYEAGERIFSTRSGYLPGIDANAGAKVKVDK
jgi:hypothetical protein